MKLIHIQLDFAEVLLWLLLKPFLYSYVLVCLGFSRIILLNSLFFCVVRFCLSETSCPQEDNYPNSLCIKVNGKLFPLPVSLLQNSPNRGQSFIRPQQR